MLILFVGWLFPSTQSEQRHPCRYLIHEPCCFIADGFGLVVIRTVRSCGVSPPHMPHFSSIPASKHFSHTGQR